MTDGMSRMERRVRSLTRLVEEVQVVLQGLYPDDLVIVHGEGRERYGEGFNGRGGLKGGEGNTSYSPREQGGMEKGSELTPRNTWSREMTPKDRLEAVLIRAEARQVRILFYYWHVRSRVCPCV
jgi:hypothetical protein